MVDLPVPASQRLRTALLVPVREPTHRNPAGDFVDDELAGLLAPTGSLGAIAAELARPDAPTVTMVVDAMLVEDATAMVGGWRLRQERQRTPVPPATRAPGMPTSSSAGSRRRPAPPAAFAYGNADLPALVAAAATGAGRRGRRADRGRAAPGDAPEESLAWPVDGAVDGALLRTIEQAGGVVVLDPRHLPAPSTTVTQNATVDLGGGPDPQRALVGDAVLSAALGDPGRPAPRSSGPSASWPRRR